MTLYIRIQFPDGLVTWEVGSTDQAAALHAAKELAGPDGKIMGWTRCRPPQW